MRCMVGYSSMPASFAPGLCVSPEPDDDCAKRVGLVRSWKEGRWPAF